MRTNYRNGDPISLIYTGCNGCSPSMVNGHLCHETSCPDSWRDNAMECKECGGDFMPQERGQSFCSEHCANSHFAAPCDCEFCREIEAGEFDD